MARRTCPRPAPAGGSSKTPLPSGPRWLCPASMRAIRPGTKPPTRPASPHMGGPFRAGASNPARALAAVAKDADDVDPEAGQPARHVDQPLVGGADEEGGGAPRQVVRLHLEQGHVNHLKARPPETPPQRAGAVEKVADRERVLLVAAALPVDPAVEAGRRQGRDQGDVVI